jgi:dihydroflavonol-4-reductase
MPGELNLVTGGAGFIGRHLVRELCARGEAVRVLDLDGAALEPGVEVIQGSILDAPRVAEAMRGVERVFHVAANPNLWARDKSEFYEVNTRGTEIVLAAARKAGAGRLVYTSTESILKGVRSRDGGPIDEQASLALADMPGPYCRSKFLAERLALAAAARGEPVVIVNPTLPIGPGDRRLTPPTRMLLGFLNGDYPAYLESEFNLVDVRDAALGHILAAEHGRVGERYILGGENVRLSQVLALLQELTGRPMPRLRVPKWLALGAAVASELIADRITKRPPKAPLTGVRLALTPMRFASAKAVAELGFRPRPVRQSLADGIAWFEAEGLLRPDRRGSCPTPSRRS